MKTEPDLQAQPAGLRFTIRKLIRGASRASLATTLAGENRPYVSLVTVSTDFDGSPLLLLSRLADHTRNIDGDPHVSLLFDGTEGYDNPQQGPRVSVVGAISVCTDLGPRERFLARHPGAALYADFADFSFYRVSLDRAHFVGGFGRAVWADKGLTYPSQLSSEFASAQTEWVEKLNAERADDLTLLVNKLLKRRGKGWRMVALDPDGFDMRSEKTVLRQSFESPLSGITAVPAAIDELVERVRRNS